MTCICHPLLDYPSSLFEMAPRLADFPLLIREVRMHVRPAHCGTSFAGKKNVLSQRGVEREERERHTNLADNYVGRQPARLGNISRRQEIPIRFLVNIISQ
jgi:hypothetical protein